ncbi:DUF2059 domain-containing protein [Pseudoxanthomonas mexicana]|uniref:DUF2059 domain-containing protein n=1 Tax=Pseudoxanthomonas mexicana TaxID=128785 RepID=UPI00398AD38F
MRQLPFRSRLLSILGLLLFAGGAWAAEPSEADIEKLLVASRAESMLQAIIPQMEAMQQEQFRQLMGDQPLTPEQQAEVQRIQARTNEIVRRTLAWDNMKPMYVQVYRQSFSRDDVRAITRFYESSAGQALLDKTPALMQNLMVAIQEKMVPMLEELQSEAQNVSAMPAPEVSPPQKRRRK